MLIHDRFFYITAALRFQPTKRPQLSAQKEKAQRLAQAQAKAAAVAAALISGVKKTVPLDAVPETQVAPKTTAADWTNDAEDDDYYAASSKRERGGRKKRKKTKQDALAPQDWDDIYDPSRPNNYEEYRHSDEKIREVREWKDRLYAHRRNRRESSYSESDEDQGPQVNSKLSLYENVVTNDCKDKFAPPALFAPPPINGVPPPPPSPPSAQEIQASQAAIVNAVPRDHGQTISRVSLPAGDDTAKNTTAKQQGNLQQIPPRSSIHPDSGTTTISRAPVRYNLPEAPTDLPKSEAELEEALRQEEEEPADSTTDNLRSSRPGQKGFAERLMSKYGWTKGSGLGADGSGIINPLRVRVEKQKKRPDSEGGGFVGPGGRGKIVGGQKKPGTEDEGGKFGPMSEVVILRGMLNGMDLEFELGEGNLMQEIGEECGEKVSCREPDSKTHLTLPSTVVWSACTWTKLRGKTPLSLSNSRTSSRHYE